MHSFHYIWYFKSTNMHAHTFMKYHMKNSFCTHKDIPYTYVLCVIFLLVLLLAAVQSSPFPHAKSIISFTVCANIGWQVVRGEDF